MREDRLKAISLFGRHEYLLHFWNDLTKEERQQLVKQFTSFNMLLLDQAFKESAFIPKVVGIEPLDQDCYIVAANIPQEMKDRYWLKGLEAIAKGQVAAVVLAGGQATRLGVAEPKGTISLGFNLRFVSDSLFALQAARISRLEDLARAAFPDTDPHIWWIVMTNSSSEEPTLQHLREMFPVLGLKEKHLIVVTQPSYPCYDVNGGLFLSSKSSFAVSPNGNGAVYECLKPYRSFFVNHDIRYFHVYSVDNILCRVADPQFIGYCINKDVIEKTDPFERVGVICKTLNGPQVIEYSELPPELRDARDEFGRLKFRAGNIANHFFTREFLHTAANFELPFHRSLKKISFIDRATGISIMPASENGYKLELFVFDSFKYAKNFHVWEVKRSEEFSPLKNSDDVGTDCLATCRSDYYSECRRWLLEANIPLKARRPIFIHPLYSYAGEGLEGFRLIGVNTDLIP
ncbi:unnamed protein product [Thelazia callipaeda]|uniref:UDP-N-acetylglucosamine diphosphorylase n=1 Tax=Thelazia callipaeda TaxID=103827 RepID=A0A0N5CV33_THECL|nr:unnamed protein product [Thelazia callipaeda]